MDFTKYKTKGGRLKPNVPQEVAQKYFLLRAKKVHKERYDYTKAVYKATNSKVIITCLEHGDFNQAPKMHIMGQGCPKCSDTTKTTSTFIQESSVTHKDLYDYTKVRYINNKTHVVIVCRKHGDFLQQPKAHIQGQGCPTCANNAHRSSTAEFIQKASIVHLNMYNYAKVDYQLALEKVTITCKKHGDFRQQPSSHLSGRGCPTCAHLEHDVIYLWQLGCSDLYKVGITKRARGEQRIRDTAKKQGVIPEVLVYMITEDAFMIEQIILKEYKDKIAENQTGDGYTEILRLTPLEAMELQSTIRMMK